MCQETKSPQVWLQDRDTGVRTSFCSGESKAASLELVSFNPTAKINKIIDKLKINKIIWQTVH